MECSLSIDDNNVFFLLFLYFRYVSVYLLYIVV
jgi:hypothetical protein